MSGWESIHKIARSSPYRSAVRQRGDANRALTAKCGDTRRVLSDDFQRLGKLVEDDRLCLDSVPLLQAFIRHRHGDSNAWTIVWRQHSIEHRRPDLISATGYIEGELGRQLAHTRCAAALPLGPDQTQVRSTRRRFVNDFLNLCDTAALDRDDPYSRSPSLSLRPVRLVQQPRARFGPSHRRSIAGFTAGAGRA